MISPLIPIVKYSYSTIVMKIHGKKLLHQTATFKSLKSTTFAPLKAILRMKLKRLTSNNLHIKWNTILVK